MHTGEFFLYGSTPCCTVVLPHGGVEGVSCLFAARETTAVLGALHTGAGRGARVHRDMTPTIRCILACVCLFNVNTNHHHHTHTSPLLPPPSPSSTTTTTPSLPLPSLLLLPTHTTHTIHHTPHTTTTTTQAFRFVCLFFLSSPLRDRFFVSAQAGSLIVMAARGADGGTASARRRRE